MLLRSLYNMIYRSSHRFGDGSGLYYLIRSDVIRYYAHEPSRIADIPLIYNKGNGMLRIDTSATWKWRDPHVPLSEWSDSGLALSDAERLDLCEKLRLFVAKQPKRFEPFE
jgi:hypothetical protein